MCRILPSLQSHLTGIEIDQYRPYPPGKSCPSIAPHWNWNAESRHWGTARRSPSIAPHWNWNLMVIHFHSVFHSPSIAPHWNWNINQNMIIDFVRFLQSHLTGIEIGLGAWVCFFWGAFNRTSLELKLKWPLEILQVQDPFNRTSLELK